jgi:hypothetical protein
MKHALLLTAALLFWTTTLRAEDKIADLEALVRIQEQVLEIQKNQLALSTRNIAICRQRQLLLECLAKLDPTRESVAKALAAVKDEAGGDDPKKTEISDRLIEKVLLEILHDGK